MEESRESHTACPPVLPALCCGALGLGKLQSVIGWEGMGEGWKGVRGEMGEVYVCVRVDECVVHRRFQTRARLGVAKVKFWSIVVIALRGNSAVT